MYELGSVSLHGQ